MTGDFKHTLTYMSKGSKDRKLVEYAIHECACESCTYRNQPWVCKEVRLARTRRGSRKGPSQSDNEPCVVTCEGYSYREWGEDEWKEAQKEMWEKRSHVKAFELPRNEEYEDYLEEQKFLMGFDYEE